MVLKKGWVLGLFLLGSCFGVMAQDGSVKGRILGFPGSLTIFTMGLGYEWMLKDDLSFQVLFNRYGYDMRDTDGGAKFTNSVVPEMRLYVGKKRQETINKAVFLGLFCELSKMDILAGGEQEGTSVFLGGNRKMISPGILIGKNVEISKRWYAEFYLGSKYIFARERKTYLINQNKEIKKSNPNKIGLRLGFNIGVRL